MGRACALGCARHVRWMSSGYPFVNLKLFRHRQGTALHHICYETVADLSAISCDASSISRFSHSIDQSQIITSSSIINSSPSLSSFPTANKRLQPHQFIHINQTQSVILVLWLPAVIMITDTIVPTLSPISFTISSLGISFLLSPLFIYNHSVDVDVCQS